MTTTQPVHLLCLLFLSTCQLFASPGVSVNLTSSLPPTPLVGVPITFTAVATTSSSNAGPLDYRFSVSQNGSDFQVIVDFNSYNTFTWAPSTREGSYTVQVIARDKIANLSESAQIQFNVQSQVVDGQPVVSATANPLVALYSAPPCPTGSSIAVLFQSASQGAVPSMSSGQPSQTDLRPCQPNISNNFYIAGMLANTTYQMSSVLMKGKHKYSVIPVRHLDSVTSPVSAPTLSFTTGSIPAGLSFPTPTVILPPAVNADQDQSILLIDDVSLDTAPQNLFYIPTAIDLSGNVLWYYSAIGNLAQSTDYYLRPVPGGTFLLFAADPNSAAVKGQLLREIDLAGNTVRETNVTRVNEQLTAMGQLGIADFDHDAIRLPNGHTLVLCGQEEIFPVGTQGSAGPIDLIGDAIVDLDTNLQVAWAWSAYDHLDINRAPVLGEVCQQNQSGCSPISLAPSAVDWLHGNSLNYDPLSGDLLFSMRSQDWIVKIDYKHGTGTGAVLWELGNGGSFTIVSTDPWPWFSHQHDAEYELNGNAIISLFDNGNARAAQNPTLIENSRGMVLSVDEKAMVVTPLLSQDLGVSSQAFGSAQRLDNGNYHFDSGFVFDGSLQVAQHSEYSINGAQTYLLQTNDIAYRSYRMVSLYQLNAPGN